MEVKIRPWCCSLDTAVVVVGGGVAVIYLVVGVLAVGWVVLQYVGYYDNIGIVSEVDSFEEAYSTVVADRDDMSAIGAISVALSFLGIICSLLVVIGIMRRSSCYLLPWLVWHVVIILACFGIGFYLAVNFTVLVDEMDVLKAVVSAVPVMAGIFLLFLWLLVEQAHASLRNRRVTASRFNNGNRGDLT